MTRVSAAVALPVLLAVAVAILALSLTIGSITIPPRQVLDALLGQEQTLAADVVRELRLPRAMSALAIGGLLAVTGTLLQALLRNPLADPYILGVSGGAAVGALSVALFLSADASPLLPLCAFGGAALSALAVFLLARRRSGVSPERLILMGVVVGAFLNAVIMLMVTLAPPGKIPGALYWLMGDLGLGTPRRVAVLFPYVALGTVLLYLLSRGLDLLLLGDHAAFQAGLPVERVKTATYLTASLLAGSVVAVSGLIGFVGLIVPHGARVLVGSGHRRLLPAAFLLGGAFLVLSDTLARTASPAGELPVGAVTALAGAPFFLYLLRRNGGRS